MQAGCIQFDGYECEVEYKEGDTQGLWRVSIYFVYEYDTKPITKFR